MKIWFQVISSETHMADFIRACQAQVDRAADPGTTVEVHGTVRGGLADNYRFFEHMETREIVDNVLRLRHADYDALVIGNSMDVALVEAREMLDIPVFALTETTILHASLMGERFGMVVANPKFVSRYRDLVIRYRQEQRMASMLPLHFAHIPDFNGLFQPGATALQDQAIEHFREVARQEIAQGAEVLIPAGPMITLLSTRGVHHVDDVPVLDGFTLMIKQAEAAVKMRRLGHPFVSRARLYASPPESLMAEARQRFQREF